MREARAAEPALTGDDLVALVSENSRLPVHWVRTAIGYWAELPAAMNRQVDAAAVAERNVAAAFGRERGLLGA